MKSKFTIFFLVLVTPIASAQSDDPAQKGNEAFSQGNFSQAVEYYSQALQKQPSVVLYVNLAHAYARLEQWPDAVKFYKAALTLKDPVIPPAEIYGYLGQAEYMRRNYTDALYDLAQAQPGKPPGTFSLIIARCLIELQRFHLAESEIIEFLKVKPDDIAAGELLAYVYMQTDQPDRAADIYQDLLKQQPTEIRYYKALAQAQVADGQYTHALDALEIARRIAAPAESNLDRLLADLYIQESMYREAASCYSRMVRHTAKPNAEDMFRLGYCYYQSRQWLSARQAFTRVLQLDPTHARAALFLGRIEAKKGDIKLAEKAYSQAAQFDAAWPDPYFALAELQEKQNQFQLAAESFRQALARHDFDATDFYRYLLVLQQAADKNQFINILIKAMAKYPRDNRLNQMMDHLADNSLNFDR